MNESCNENLMLVRCPECGSPNTKYLADGKQKLSTEIDNKTCILYYQCEDCGNTFSYEQKTDYLK